MALLLMALVIGLAACKTQPAPAPAAPAVGSSVNDDLGSLDEVSEEVSVESLDDLDASLGDLENLDI